MMYVTMLFQLTSTYHDYELKLDKAEINDNRLWIGTCCVNLAAWFYRMYTIEYESACLTLAFFQSADDLII